jgi:hypothetical protein
MNNAEMLKESRNLLLRLHKVMMDSERQLHEGIHGPLSATQFLTVLLEDEDFAWLRKFSMLIVEIDEMFAQRGGYPTEMVDANNAKVRELVEMADPDEYFRAKYEYSLRSNAEAAVLQSQLKELIG